MFRSSIARVLLAGAAGGAAAGCGDDPARQCACREVFQSFSITVLDDASQPVADADLTITHGRTGRELVPTWLGLLAPGHYVVADDGMLDEFSDLGDPVRVTGQSPAGAFTADFLFAPDACRCHLQRVAGPDTVVIGEPPPG